MKNRNQFRTSAAIKKVDLDLGLVFGFAIICKVDGEPYYDLHNHHISEIEMTKAAVGFMEESRAAWDMHAEPEGGSVVFAMPLTPDIAKAFGLDEPTTTGLMIAMKPDNPETLEKFHDGTYRGFSIGGAAIVEEIEEPEDVAIE